MADQMMSGRLSGTLCRRMTEIEDKKRDGLPFLLDVEVENQVAQECEDPEEDSKKRDVGPPEGLHEEMKIRMKNEQRRGTKRRTWARSPNSDRMVAAGISMSTPSYRKSKKTREYARRLMRLLSQRRTSFCFSWR